MGPFIREARPGDEKGIHEAHMRSIREICVKEHGEEEVRGWGNRPLGGRWIKPIKEGHVWVVEYEGQIHGHGYLQLSVFNHLDERSAAIEGLYLTPEVCRKGIGTQLALLMIAKAKENWARTIYLSSTLTALGFYKRLGFQERGPVEKSVIGGSLVRSYPMILKPSFPAD